MIRYICPGCGATLELPADAGGRDARCPACQRVFTVDADRAARAAATAAAAGHAPAMLGIDQIASTTVGIIRRAWKPLLLCTLAFLALLVVVHLPAFPLLMIDADAPPSPGMAVAMLTVQLATTAAGLYVNLGYFHAVLAITRHTPHPLRALFVSWRVLGRAVAGGVIIGVVAAALVALAVLLAWLALRQQITGQSLYDLLAGIAALLVLVELFAAQLCLWPWLFAVCEPDQTAMGALRLTLRIVAHNKLVTLLLAALAAVLAAAGTALCLVGNLVTLPIAVVMLAVAYERMSGRTSA